MWRNTKEWFFKANVLEKSIIIVGCILAFYAVAGTIKTSKWSISEDLNVWKDRAEFWGLVLGPYLTLVGLYYVWKTLQVSAESRLIDHYSSELNRLDDSLLVFSSKWANFDLILIDNRIFNVELQSVVSRLNFYVRTIRTKEELRSIKELKNKMVTVDDILLVFLIKYDIVTFETNDPESPYIIENQNRVLTEETITLLNTWVEVTNSFVK